MKFVLHCIRLVRIGLGGLAIFFPLASMSCHAEDKSALGKIVLPATLVGSWQVAEVHVDTGASRRRYYQHNDPRLMGRRFTIVPRELTSNTFEASQCLEPKVSIRRVTTSDLIKDSMAGRGYAPNTPTPKDYQLPLGNDAQVDVFSVFCKNDGLFEGGLGHKIEGAWIVALGKDRLVMRWHDETILRLHRVPENAKPDPSFDCGKASTVAEETICGSEELAALDRNMAQTYRFATELFRDIDEPEVLGRFRTMQKKWLTQRNGCGADAKCLEKSMIDRMHHIGIVTDLRGRTSWPELSDQRTE